jgi:hypothetical protein
LDIAPPSGRPAVEYRFYSRGYQASTHQKRRAKRVIHEQKRNARAYSSILAEFASALDGVVGPILAGERIAADAREH